MRRRGRDATTPAKARSKPRWRFTIAPADQPSGFSALMAHQDTGGLWIADNFDPGPMERVDVISRKVVEWAPGRFFS